MQTVFHRYNTSILFFCCFILQTHTSEVILLPTVVTIDPSVCQEWQRTRKGVGLVCPWSTVNGRSLSQAFRCLFLWFRVAYKFGLCLYCDYWPYTVNFMVKFCDIGLIKSLLVAKLLWGCELKVDAAHSRGSAYSVILQKNHYPFPFTERDSFNWNCLAVGIAPPYLTLYTMVLTSRDDILDWSRFDLASSKAGSYGVWTDLG